MTVSEQQPDGGEGLGALTAEAEVLAEAVDDLRAALRRSRRFGIATMVGLVLDVTLTIILATVLNGQSNTNHRIQDSLRQNYITQQQQSDTRVRILCPLYSVLLSSASTPPNPPLSPAAQKIRNASVKTIKDGYITLGCQSALPKAP